MASYSILIIDDHIEWCTLLQNTLENKPQFHVLPPAHNGEDALQSIIDNRPDILILDFVLPVYDGVYLVDYVRKQMQDYHPFIYIISDIRTEKTAQLLNELEINYYNIKPVKPINILQNLERFLYPSAPIRKNTYASLPPNSYELDMMIDAYLHSLGAPLNKVSTRCTKLVLKKYYQLDVYERKTLGDIYKQAASELIPPATPASVERNVRSTIKNIDNAQTDLYHKYFPTMPNNSVFIHFSVSILKNQIARENMDALSRP